MGINEQHPNVVLFRRIIHAFNNNDLPTISKYVHENLIYRVSGKIRISGVYEGPLAFNKVLETVKELTNGTIALEPLITLADDEYVFMFARATGKRGQKNLNIEHCYLYRFDNGKLVEGRTMPVDLYAFDEFWV